MTNDDLDEFIDFWQAMRESYPQAKPLTEQGVAIEFEALKPFGELSDIKRALSAHKRNDQDGMYVPTSAHLMKYLKGDSESRALSAWTLVQRAIESIGQYDSVVFEHPAIMASIVDMGGWLELCKMTESEQPFKKNEFVKRYNGYMIAPPKEWPKSLPGLSELYTPDEFSHMVRDAKLIGNTKHCLAVYQRGSDFNKKTVSLKTAMKSLSNKMAEKPEKK